MVAKVLLRSFELFVAVLSPRCSKRFVHYYVVFKVSSGVLSMLVCGC